MKDIKLSYGTIYEYNSAAVDKQDDPDTPLCVASVDGIDTVFISPLPKYEDNKFIAIINGNEMKFPSKEALLNEIELDLVDKETSDKFFEMCEDWWTKKESIKVVKNSINSKKYLIKECKVNGVMYEYDISNSLYINGRYSSTISPEHADILFNSLLQKK